MMTRMYTECGSMVAKTMDQTSVEKCYTSHVLSNDGLAPDSPLYFYLYLYFGFPETDSTHRWAFSGLPHPRADIQPELIACRSMPPPCLGQTPSFPALVGYTGTAKPMTSKAALTRI